MFPSTYTMQHRSRQHTHIHTHIDFCLWGRIGHARPNHIINRVCYTSAPTTGCPQALCISGISFALQRGLPRGRGLQSPGAAMAPTTLTGKEARWLLPRSWPPSFSRTTTRLWVVEDISSAQPPRVAQEEPHPRAPSLLQTKSGPWSSSSQKHLCGEDALNKKL